jgi:hypothetical protein
MSTMQSKKLIAREYMKAADDIYANQRIGGSFSTYMDDQLTSVQLASAWNNWGRGNFEKATAENILAIGNSLNNVEEKKFYDKISFKDDIDYLEMFEGDQNVINNINSALRNIFHFSDNNANNANYNFFTSEPETIVNQNSDLTFTKAHSPELLKIDTIRKNIFLYNKIFILKNNGFKRFKKNEPEELICYRNSNQRDVDIYGTREYTFNYAGDMYKNNFIINSSTTNKGFKELLKEIMFSNYLNDVFIIFGTKNDANFQYRGSYNNNDIPNEKIQYQVRRCTIDIECSLPGYHDCDTSYRDDYGRWMELNKDQAEDLRGGHFDLPAENAKEYIENVLPADIDANFIKIDGIYVPKNNKEYFVEYEVIDIGNLFHDLESDNGRKILNVYKYLLNLDNGKKYDYTNEIDLTGDLNFFKNDGDSNIDLTTNKMTITTESPNLILSIRNKQNGMFSVRLPKWYLMKRVINFMASTLQGNNNIEFLKDEEELDRTIDGDECQEWNSHEVHDETSWLDILNPKYTFPKNGKIWGSMFRPDKLLIKDGLLKAKMARGNTEYTIDRNGVVIEEQVTPDSEEAANSPSLIENNLRDEANDMSRIEDALKNTKNNTSRFLSNDNTIKSKIKWVSHNKCRNPGNYKGAPWCYTKNPKVRWQYCTKPDYSQVIARTVLLITFLFCFILSYLAVKAIFKGELFTAFVAKLTGAAAGAGSGAGGLGKK